MCVILAGSLVRATGAGMGCPDWPRCFGRWVPPTHISQLPADYQTRYSQFGSQVEPFNALKTWTEYGNRMLGVICGLVLIALVIQAIRLKVSRVIRNLAIASLALVIVQGVMGALVVFLNLHAGMVSLHMVLAIALASILVVAETHSLDGPPATLRRGSVLILRITMGLTAFQILVGTQVREAVDQALTGMGMPREWVISAIGPILGFHQILGLSLIVCVMVMVLTLLQDPHARPLRPTLAAVTLAVTLGVTSGMVLHQLHLPQWGQPIHLLMAILLWLGLVRMWGRVEI